MKIINHLATEYLKNEEFLTSYKASFGKIELIKIMRNYASLHTEEDFGNLRHAKDYVEKIIKEKTI